MFGGIEARTVANFVLSELKQGRRCDLAIGGSTHRPYAQPRERQVQLGVFPHTVGSAAVKIGASVTVFAGITPEFGPADPEHPDEGRVDIEVHFPPISGLTMNESQRKSTAFQISTIVGSCLDLKQLCIVPAEACWVLKVDIVVAEQDGALLDACATATLAALRDCKLPQVTLPDGETKTVEHKVDLGQYPVVLTFAVVNEVTLADPTAAELQIAGATALAAVSPADGSLVRFSHLGGFPVSNERTEEILAVASQYAKKKMN